MGIGKFFCGALALVIACQTYLIQSVSGQTWTGAAGNGSWVDGQNWTGGSAPDGTQDVNIVSASATIALDTAGAFTFGSGGNGQTFLLNSAITGGTGIQISGQSINWANDVSLRNLSDNNSFNGNWQVLDRLTLSREQSDDFATLTHTGAVFGTGEIQINQGYSLVGSIVSTGDVGVHSNFTFDGSVSGGHNGAVLDHKVGTVVGNGDISRNIVATGAGNRILRASDGGQLMVNSNLSIDVVNGSQNSYTLRNVEMQGDINVQSGLLRVVGTLNGRGLVDVGNGATLEVRNQAGTSSQISERMEVTLNGGSLIGDGVFNGESIAMNGGLVSVNEVNSIVNATGGTFGSGTYNGRVSLFGDGQVGNSNGGEVTFNGETFLLGVVDITADKIAGNARINVGTRTQNATVTASAGSGATEFSATNDWIIASTQFSGLGQAAANSFFGNNVLLVNSTLEGTATNFQIAGNLTTEGDVVLNQSFSVNGDTTLNAGTLTISAGRTLSVNNLVVSNDSDLINNGTLGTTNLVLEAAALNGNVSINNGLVVRTGGTSELTSGAVVNVSGLTDVQAGTLRVDNGALLEGTGELEVASTGTLDLQGTIAKDTTVMVGGQLSGVGTIEGLLAVEGNLGPGNSAGTLTVDGAVEVKDGATVAIELGGIDLGVGYDTVDGNGTSSLSLDGILDVSFIDGFNAMSTDSFFVLNNFTSVTGRFENTAADELMVDGGTFDVEYGSSFVRLYNFESAVAVPEPNAFVALAICGLYASGRRRRKR